MIEYLEGLFQTDIGSAAAIIFNLILIESLLSVDNAAVLATMVMDLKADERKRALRYGIIGAYFFRGLCLLFVTQLVKIWWLKPLGGLYLIYLTYDFFKSKQTKTEADDTLNKEEKWFYKITNGLVGTFWATVIAVEIMDLAFSLDNVFAAVAFSENIYLICVGVFIGILAMRFVAQYFVDLIEKYPFLEYSAFIVIGILGLKLLVSGVCHYYPEHNLAKLIESETTDLVFSIITTSFFFVPLLTSRFWGWPKNFKRNDELQMTNDE
jgi:YkoY family integral membrane protein